MSQERKFFARKCMKCLDQCVKRSLATPARWWSGLFTKICSLGIAWNVRIYTENSSLPPPAQMKGCGAYLLKMFCCKLHELSRTEQKIQVLQTLPSWVFVFMGVKALLLYA